VTATRRRGTVPRAASSGTVPGMTADTSDDAPLSGTWLPEELRRYTGKDTIDDAGLEDVCRRIRYAWNHALNFPDIGDEIIDDLQADVQQIITRERQRLTEQYAAAAKEKAEQIAVKAMRGAEVISADAIDGLLTERPDEGFNPNGCFVYLLWASNDDKVPLYVGKSTNVLARIGDHLRDPARRYRIHWVTLIRCRTERRMEETEGRLIRKYRPELNTAGIPAEDYP
jgi:hypothetical protein